MIKTIKTAVILLATLLLAWLLPWFYTFLFASPSWSPFTLYSCVTHSFASISYDGEGKIAGRDFKGNTYTEHQFDSILPMFYYRQLASEGRFPSRIEGVAVDVRDAERSGFIFRSSPSEINRRKPELYQLLESMPARVDFKSPTDVFRITEDGIEFVDMATNTLDRAKSDAFTRVMKDKGFAFPARVIAGNASTRKDYDNGYFIVDNDFKVYHLKQMRGRPFVRRTDIPAELGIRHIFVTEYADHRLFGFLVDKDNRFYALEAEDYSLHELPVGTFDPAREGMMIIGDMFYWTVTVQAPESERLVAVNARDYSRARRIRASIRRPNVGTAGRVPFSLQPVVHLAARRLREAAPCRFLLSRLRTGGGAGRGLCRVAPPRAARANGCSALPASCSSGFSCSFPCWCWNPRGRSTPVIACKRRLSFDSRLF